MFENLKAFIRHGKQANELKKKPLDIGSPVLIDTNQVRNISNFPSLPNELSETLTTEKYEPLQQHLQEPQFTVTDADSRTTDIEQYIAEPNVTSSVPAESNAYSYASTTAAPVAPSADTGAGNYENAATQIVEQENIQRQKGKVYPKLDNYQILEQMGEGAFSVVYKAQNRKTGQFVAIKILRKFQMDQAQKQSVLKEVTIMRQLDHPNIVKFIEFIDSDQYYYIVQELAVGGEIFTAIVKYTYLSENLSRHVILQVASAIRYLHEEVGIVHRDIKPENILYGPIEFQPSVNPIAKLRKSDDPQTKEDEGEYLPGIGGGGIGQVKLADFGLSKQIWEHNTKTPCGTVGYTAPEIVRDEKYSKEVDMWAIGCVLYTLLCGFPPFYDERIESLTEKVARGEYKFLAPWWDEISPLAKNCVSKLLTVDPVKRYTIVDFLNDPWIKAGGELPNYATTLQKLDSSNSTYVDPVISAHPINNEIASQNGVAARYSKKYKNSGMYSPAAVALRDAFDISAAVHRMGEEAALSNRFGNTKDMQELIEEEEEEEMDDNMEHVDVNGKVLSQVPRKMGEPTQVPKIPVNLFDLNLGGASILERRKNKLVPIV